MIVILLPLNMLAGTLLASQGISTLTGDPTALAKTTSGGIIFLVLAAISLINIFFIIAKELR